MMVKVFLVVVIVGWFSSLLTRFEWVFSFLGKMLVNITEFDNTAFLVLI